MKEKKRGILIAVEGIDGSGKSTLAHNIFDRLRAGNIPVTLTKEPGATELGSQLRSILHEKPFEFCPKAEYLLFAADRAQHMDTIVQPALEHNNIVISDRMGDSSVVYQGYARGLEINMIEAINNWTMNNINPDLIFYVQLSAEQAMERIKKRNKTLTSFEKEGKAFIEALIAGFNELFEKRTNVVWLDGTQSRHKLTETALKHLSTWITQQHE